MGSGALPIALTALAIGGAAFSGGASLGLLGATGTAVTAGDVALTTAAGGGTLTTAAAGATTGITASQIGTAASLAGSAVSAVGQYSAAQAASAAEKYNANLATQNANRIGEVGDIQVANQEMQTRNQEGAIRAGIAGKGLDVNSGSAVDVQSSARQLGELNALTIRSQNVQQALSQQNQAALDTSTAKNDTTAGYLNASSTLLTGAGKNSQYLTPSNPSTYNNWLAGNSM